MTEWPTAPASVSLPPDSVDVWAVELDGGGFTPEDGTSPLSPAEVARATKFKFERDRRRFIVAHKAVREIVARYAEADGGALEFIEGGNGKPRLAGSFAAAGIEFNLSHSNERALIAVVRGREVGVDIEFVQADFLFDEVVERFFTSREVARLRALPSRFQRRAFYKCWTSKEAFLKAKGTGLSGKLDEVEILWTGGNEVRIGACVPGWSLAELNPGESYEAAIVIQGAPLPFRRYRWQPQPGSRR